ncbi:MAG: BatA domain-containing protein [Gemmatimonadota bacterium]|nr:BatA domain-containing protein [Gemmatimonadota bacterium]
MPLGFLVPAFLAGLAALAIPVLLHLRQRDRDRPFRFPSLMFLYRIPIRTAQHRRITDWPLLLLRALAVALLVLAFARPLVDRAAAAAAALDVRTVVVALDQSLSMGHTSVWPAALDSARAVIAELGADDRVAVVFFDDEATVAQPLTLDHATAVAAIETARPSARGTRYASALRAGRQLLLADGASRGEILVITDLQRSGVTGLAGLELPEGIQVRAISAAPADRGNTAISGIDVQRIQGEGRGRMTLAARVMTRGLEGPRRVRLDLTVNGRASGSREITLAADGIIPVAFDPVSLPAGAVRVTVTAAPDALPADDVFHALVPAEDAERIILVSPGDAAADETLFLERALEIGRDPVMRVERRLAGMLGSGVLEGAAVVVLYDVAPPPGTAGNALAEWVRAGGGLIMAAGARLSPRTVEAGGLLPGSLRGPVDRLNDRGGVFGDVSLEHPVFSPFRAGASGALGSARFLRYARVEPTADAEVVAKFDDGLPALLERKDGEGRVLLVVAPLDTRSGDFPLQAAYLPFLRRLAVHASGRVAAPLWQSTGEAYGFAAGVQEPVIESPSGELIRPASPGPGAAITLGESGFYGTYAVRVQGEPAAQVAVNPPTREADLTPMDPRELLLGVGQETTVVGAGPPATAREVEGRQRLWRVLLLIVAALLIAETLLASRGWRGIAGRLAASPERSTP